jgi:Cu/Ag efflux pump CusA
MRFNEMTEPASTAAGGLMLYKLGAFGGFAVLAAIVVMAMTLPKTVREFVVAMVSTVVSSICGGAAAVSYLGISHWINDDFGFIAIGGLIFLCGLPAWVLVRASFAYAEMRKDKTIVEIITEVKAAVWK